MIFVSLSTWILTALCVGFSLVVLLRKPGSPRNVLFSLGLLAMGAIAVGDWLTLSERWNAIDWQRLSMAGSVLFPVTWLLFPDYFVRSGPRPRRLALLGASLLVVTLLWAAISLNPADRFLYAPDLNSEGFLYVEPAGFYFYLLIVFLSVAALVRVEGLLWAAQGGMRWNVKYAVVGVGGLLGMFVYYYSQPILYRSINMGLLISRNTVFILSTLLLIAAFVRQRFLELDVFVSRRVVFRSATLLAIGLYFVFLGLAGEGLRYFGENFSRNLTVVLAALGILLLLAIVLTERYRVRIKRFITDNFYRHRYEYKDEWLKFTSHLARATTLRDVVHQVSTIMIETFSVRSASYWKVDPDSGECRFLGGSPESGGRGGATFVVGPAFLNFARTGAIYDRRRPSPLIESEAADMLDSVGARVLIPALSGDRPIGFIAMGENATGLPYDDEDYELMLTLSRQSVFAIERTELATALTEAREMEAMGKVTSFVMHDLKNMTSSLSMLVRNADDHLENPDFQQDMLKTIRSSLERMDRVMKKLAMLREPQKLRFSPVDLSALVTEVLGGMAFPSRIRCEVTGTEGQVLVRADREELRKVLVNILLNAVEAMSGVGCMAVEVWMDKDKGCVKISDTGVGMSREFMETRLFKAFQTTKSGGLGIGLFHCRSIMESHGGRLEVMSEEGRGSTFTLILPASSSAPAAGAA